MAFTKVDTADASYTPTNADDEKLLVFSHATPTLDLQNDAAQMWVPGTIMSGTATAGNLSINPNTGVTIQGSTITRTIVQNHFFTLINMAGADTWLLFTGYQSINQMPTAADININNHSLLQIGAAEFDVNAPSAGTSFTPAVDSNSVHQFIANGAATVNAPTGEATSGEASFITMLLEQDGTGGRSWTLNAVFKPAGGSPPTFSTASGDIDVVQAVTTDGGTEWFYWLAGSFAS